MNERELSLIKNIGEVLDAHISGITSQLNKSLQEQLNKSLQEHMTLVGGMLSSMGEELHALAKSTPPDFRGMVDEAISALPQPAPPDIPDIEKMVQDAVAQIELLAAPTLPNIERMVAEAIGRIEIPSAPELPDLEKMVQEQVSMAVSALPEAHDGADGKDALQLEILPDISEEKSYPRGTYAMHKGGLWRAYQKTVGLKGWECVVSGVHSVDVEQNGQREFRINLSLSDGVVVDKSFTLPVLIYRGVFKAGEAYRQGDTVTWGGSLWHCDSETLDKPGEIGSKGWTLAAKRGRDGKDK
ncbi:hypothetical protein LLQ54_20100 [Rouxiella badensis]|uniref:hypothetical protein n=1 Tax=Rouxiella badensis TaxID=1646377 RepID=UPI001D135254|nr:hypothetical protein [Rouxiella badensis]MCC3720531.1 hypothetical protein [Rouxiella badensis]MCC3730370.1 hypothetical protein [Rouxiella badensis]MCC3742179.1 hypothetical protein [Rouxiella badensis]